MVNNIKTFKEKKAQLVDKEGAKVQHQKGKLTAQERLDILLDEGSFVEVGSFAELQSNNFNLQDKKRISDGVITGYGTMQGRPVYVTHGLKHRRPVCIIHCYRERGFSRLLFNILDNKLAVFINSGIIISGCNHKNSTSVPPIRKARKRR